MKVIVTILLLSLCFNSSDLRAMQKGEVKIYLRGEKVIKDRETTYNLYRSLNKEDSTGSVTYNSANGTYYGNWEGRTPNFSSIYYEDMSLEDAKKYYEKAQRLETEAMQQKP